LVENAVQQKDVRHVTLKMSPQDIEAYSGYGWNLGDKVLKQPPGIDIIWYPRTGDTVSATFFTSPLNPDPLARKTGEDIDKELSYLPVVSDKASPEGKVTHPYLKVETILSNPQLDYNKGELDFLRSKPVKGRTEWKQKHEIDLINAQFRAQQKLMGEPEQLLKMDESKSETNPFTGEKYYPFEVAQVTSGGDKEHFKAQDTTKDGGTDTAFAVPTHEQEVSNGLHETKRWYDGSRRHMQKPVRIEGKTNRETMKL
jgi:hypothetical protein